MAQAKAFFYLIAFVCASCCFANAQGLPKEIRGYKVRKAKITVVSQSEKLLTKEPPEVSVKIGEPELIDVSLTGITFEITAEINSLKQSGTIDFLTFHDFRVNDLKVEVEEYREAFEFKKNQTVALPKPIKIFLGTKQTLRGALEEMKESKDEWTVTGRILVFGQFTKSFLKFKRVVPVEINLKIKNPIKKSASVKLTANLNESVKMIDSFRFAASLKSALNLYFIGISMKASDWHVSCLIVPARARSNLTSSHYKETK